MKLFSVNGFKIVGNQMRNLKKNILALLILINLVVLIELVKFFNHFNDRK